MSKIIIGSIPEKISYIFADQREVEVGCSWDATKKLVIPTISADSSDKEMVKRAIDRISDGGYDVNGIKKVIKSYSIKEIDNQLIKNVQLLSLDRPEDGDHFCKILINNHYFDFRKDVLIESILKLGVESGGVLNGEYIWARVHGQAKLIRAGSELHKSLIEYKTRKLLKPIKNLEVGGIYRTRRGDKAIYLGLINTTFMQRITYPHGKSFEYDLVPQNKVMLFESSHHDLNFADEDITKYRFLFKASHNFIEKMDQVEITNNNHIELFRHRAIKVIEEMFVNYSKRFTRQHELEYNIQDFSNLLNMFPFGTKEIEVFNPKKYLMFS